jgi:hypothetical protein
MTKPDFNDPGYGEIGCFFVAIGILAGFPIAFLGVVTGLVPDPNPDTTYDFPLWLAEVSLCAATIGILGSASLVWLVERVRVLWGVGDVVVPVSWPVIPAVVVLILTWTPIGAALLVPLSIASLILWAVGSLLMVAWLVLVTVRQHPLARVKGHADDPANRPAKRLSRPRGYDMDDQSPTVFADFSWNLEGWRLSLDGWDHVIELGGYNTVMGAPLAFTVNRVEWKLEKAPKGQRAAEFRLGSHRARLSMRQVLPSVRVNLRLRWRNLTDGGILGFLAAGVGGLLLSDHADPPITWFVYELTIDGDSHGAIVLTTRWSESNGAFARAFEWTAVEPSGPMPAPNWESYPKPTLKAPGKPPDPIV